MRSFFFCAVGLLLAVLVQGAAAQTEARELRPQVQQFVLQMSERHGFDADSLRALLAKARTQDSILKAIAAPATARPWHEYRLLYVNPERITAGLRFWSDNARTVARASHTFGVPEEIIVATIGVETNFGRNRGKYRVLDALYTLAFDWPPRAEYFRSELEQFLLLTREQGLDPLKPRGSYAGAMGIAQFMPSSVRRYAVDFDHSGRPDLSRDADAIGSVANYMREFGWEPGSLVAVPVKVEGERIAEFLEHGLKPTLTVEQLTQGGVSPEATVPWNAEAALLRLEAESGPEYWLGFNNFYVITRYNRSVNYAMSVHELAQALKEARGSAAGPTEVKLGYVPQYLHPGLGPWGGQSCQHTRPAIPRGSPLQLFRIR